MTFWKCIFNRL